VLAVAVTPLSAQQKLDLEPDELIWGTMSSSGFSQNSAAGSSANVLGFEPAITLRSWERNSFGIRLLLAFRIANVRLGDPDFRLDDLRLGLFAPGVEFVVPIARRALLRPRVSLGLTSVFQGDSALVWTNLGLGAEFVFPWKKFELGLEPRIDWLSAIATDNRYADEHLGLVTLQADARHPLWFKLGEYQPDAGIYATGSYAFEPLGVPAASGAQTALVWQAEVGAILGFQSRPKVWFVRIPTIGVGYRFGDLSGLRIRIGGDRLLRLAEAESRE
jgi:hypothetical protein